jgi:predicted transcriptional regulator
VSKREDEIVVKRCVLSCRITELAEAQETISRLEAQMRELQAAKQELEVQQNELSDMLKRLEEAKNMEAAEKVIFAF